MTKFQMLTALDNWFQSWNGYLEKKNGKNLGDNTPEGKVVNAGYNNYTYFWKVIEDASGQNYQGGAWCAGTITAANIMLFGKDITRKLMYLFPAINCQALYMAFRDKGRAFSTPQSGDYIVFWNGSRMHHIEYVLKVEGDKFWTAGGNTSSDSSIVVDNGGALRYGKQYSVSACRSAGHKFLRPDYDAIASVESGSSCKGNVVTVSNLNVRTAPVSGSIVKTLKSGDAVIVSEYVFTNGAYWFKSADGWLSGNYVKGWIQTSANSEWWYMTGVKSNPYYRQTVKVIDGQAYCFKSDGYALKSDWYLLGSNWYYAYDNCALITSGWLHYKEADYYFTKDSVMATDSYILSADGMKYYYVDKEGKWDNKEYATVDVPPKKIVR